ncbi:MAG: hypothetical protein J5752_04700 [Clostridiales bacterium]|nr:hypothetical protein [Clostridiales bacterium]
MKKGMRSVLACFLLTFFGYFRYLLVMAVLLFIGSIFFHPLLYAGVLVIGLDLVFSILLTTQVAMVVPRSGGQKFLFQFQHFGSDLSDPSERIDTFDFEYKEEG